MTRNSTLAPVRGAFRAVVRAAVPAAAELDEAAWRRGEALVDDALAERPADVRRQLVLFLRLLGVLGWLRFGRSLERVSSEQACRLLSRMERAPLLLVRRGVWGLRTLAFMGVYGQGGVRRDLGYQAAAGGWQARGAGPGPWPGRAGAAPPEDGVLVAPQGEDDGG